MGGHSFYIEVFYHPDLPVKNFFCTVPPGTAAQKSRAAADETLSFRKSQLLSGNFSSPSIQYVKVKKSSQRMLFFRYGKISLNFFRRQIQQIKAFQPCVPPVFP